MKRKTTTFISILSLLTLFFTVLTMAATAGTGEWTWTGASTLQTGSIAISPNYVSDQTLFAAGGRIYGSTDGGENWANVLDEQMQTVAVSPNYELDQTVFAAGDGLLKSTDGGQLWTQMSTGMPEYPNILSLAVSPDYPSDQTVIAGTYHRGVFKTTDGGSSWLPVNTGLTWGDFDNLATEIRAVVVSPNYALDKTVFAGTFHHIYKSVNGGLSWDQITTISQAPVYSLAISPDYASDQTIFAATWTGLFRSSDGGATWETLFDDYGYPAVAVSPDYASDQTVFAAAYDLERPIRQSVDGGASWRRVPIYPFNEEPYLPDDNFLATTSALGVPPNFVEDQTVFAGTILGVYAYTFETTPPVTSIETSPALPYGESDWYRVSPEITLNPDETAYTYFQLDTTASGSWSIGDTTSIPDGVHELYFYSVDMAENTESVQSFGFKVDQVNPVDPSAFESFPALDTWTNNSTITVSWPLTGEQGGASDGLGSGVDGFSASWSQNTTETPDGVKDMEETAVATTSPTLADGAWWFNLRTKDTAGNWTSTVHLGPFKVDTEPPSTNIGRAEPDGENGWYKTNPEITLTPDESVTTHLIWNGGESTTYTAPFNIPADGTHTLEYFSIDRAGNREATHTVAVKLDGTVPVDPIVDGSYPLPGSWTSQNAIEINWPLTGEQGGASDGLGSGVDGFSASWSQNTTETPDGVKDMEETAVATTGLTLANGLWWFNLRTKDTAGNWTSTVHLGPFKIDTMKPAGIIRINNGATYAKTTNVTLNLEALDAGGSGLDKMRFMNASGSWSSWENYSTAKSWTLTSSQGIKRIYFQVKDGAGNISSTFSDTIKLDTKNPVTSMVTPFVSTRISKTTTFKVKWSAIDASPSSGIRSYTVKYRPDTLNAWRTWKSNTSATEALFRGKAGVTYYFKMVAYDNAGNRDWSKIYKTIVPVNEGVFTSKTGFLGYYKSGASQNYLTSVRYSYKRGHTLRYKFYKNNGIGLVVTKGPTMGRAKIYVDGKYVTTVDAHSSKVRPRQHIYYRNFSKKGTHYLKVVNLGTPGRARFEVDGVVVKR